MFLLFKKQKHGTRTHNSKKRCLYNQGFFGFHVLLGGKQGLGPGPSLNRISGAARLSFVLLQMGLCQNSKTAQNKLSSNHPKNGSLKNIQTQLSGPVLNEEQSLTTSLKQARVCEHANVSCFCLSDLSEDQLFSDFRQAPGLYLKVPNTKQAEPFAHAMSIRFQGLVNGERQYRSLFL